MNPPKACGLLIRNRSQEENTYLMKIRITDKLPLTMAFLVKKAMWLIFITPFL